MSQHDTRLTRRQALTAGAVMAAAPFIAKGFWPPAHAAAPLLGPSHPNHYRFKLGAFEVTTIWDGAIELDGPHPIFGANQPAEAVQKLAAENFLPEKRMSISFTPVIVNTGKEVILFDTGNPPARRPHAGKLAAALEQAGFKPGHIDLVVITHCHPDHIGGLMQEGKPLFPNARYVIGETEYGFWSNKDRLSGSTEANAKLVQSNVEALAEKMTFIKPDAEAAPGIRAVEAFGHTPGHMAYHIESDGKRFLIWADITNHYVASLQRPDWHVRFDMDKEMAAATRKRILDMAAAGKMPVTGYHMPFPAIGFVEKKDGGYRWAPASYELNL